MACMSSEQKKAFKRRQKEEFLAIEAIAKSFSSRASDVKPSPTSLLSPVNLSLSNEHNKDESIEMGSLTDTQHCTESKVLATVIGTMVANTLKHDNLEKHALLIRFYVYYEKLCWKSEDYMIASEGTCRPDLT